MKTVTINVSEPIYRQFQRVAQQQGKSTSQLIREAMAAYRREFVKEQTSLAELESVSLGRIKKPLSPSDDLLGEMLDSWS